MAPCKIILNMDNVGCQILKQLPGMLQIDLMGVKFIHLIVLFSKDLKPLVD